MTIVNYHMTVFFYIFISENKFVLEGVRRLSNEMEVKQYSDRKILGLWAMGFGRFADGFLSIRTDTSIDADR
ncbi:hypothetical protein D3C73_1361600 [compost metagenome]